MVSINIYNIYTYSSEQGSNLHGFVNEYKRIVSKRNLPERMKKINWKRRELGYKPSIYSNDIE